MSEALGDPSPTIFGMSEVLGDPQKSIFRTLEILGDPSAHASGLHKIPSLLEYFSLRVQEVVSVTFDTTS